jgi:hypothetical protein
MKKPPNLCVSKVNPHLLGRIMILIPSRTPHNYDNLHSLSSNAPLLSPAALPGIFRVTSGSDNHYTNRDFATTRRSIQSNDERR